MTAFLTNTSAIGQDKQGDRNQTICTVHTKTAHWIRSPSNCLEMYTVIYHTAIISVFFNNSPNILERFIRMTNFRLI